MAATTIDRHDMGTFLDVLEDYFMQHDIEISRPLGRLILKRCFGPHDVFRGSCALEYGDYLLVAGKPLSKSAKTLLVLDPAQDDFHEYGLPGPRFASR